MTAQQLTFDRILAEVIEADGPKVMPAGFLDGPIAATAIVRQRRRPVFLPDHKAWPPTRPIGLTPMALRLVAAASLVALTITAAALVGGHLHLVSPSPTPTSGPSLTQGLTPSPSELTGKPFPPLPGSLIVWTADAAGSGVLRFVEGQGRVTRSFDLPLLRHCPRVLPDGQHVAYWGGADGGSLVLQPLDGSAATVVPGTTFRDPGSEIWSLDGWRVALRLQELRIVDALTGNVLRPTGANGLRSVAWAPDGTLTVARQVGPEISIQSLDLATSASTELFRFTWDSGVDGYPFFSWSPDGRYLLYSINNYADVVVFDRQSGITTTILTGSSGLYDPWSAWSSDGRLALVDRAGRVVIARPDGSRIATVVLAQAAASTSLVTRWTPDGSSLAVSDFESVAVTMAADGTNQQVHSQQHPIGGMEWSPDSAWLAVRITSVNDDHAAETLIELYPADGRDAAVIGPFVAKDGSSGSGWPCLAWEE